MRDPSFRYFLGSRPDPQARDALAGITERAGQRKRPELLHLTLCVIAETDQRDVFLSGRVDAALAGDALSSAPIRFGRVFSGTHGAVVRTIGRQPAIQHLYDRLIMRLEKRGIEPLYRKSGLRPHVTLGYARCEFDPFYIAVEWVPQELLLIESEVWNGRHNVVGRWSLLAPAQGMLPFEAPNQCWRLAS